VIVRKRDMWLTPRPRGCGRPIETVLQPTVLDGRNRFLVEGQKMNVRLSSPEVGLRS
jgi:hypothetical protein